MEILFSNIKIWDIKSQVRIEKYNHIQRIFFTWLAQKTSSNHDLWLFFFKLVYQLFHFCGRISMVWIHYQSFCFIFILDIFSYLLGSNSIRFYRNLSALFTSCRKIILHLTDMTQSHQISIRLLMKRNRHGTSFTIRNMPTFCTNDSRCVSLFIHNYSDFFSHV